MYHTRDRREVHQNESETVKGRDHLGGWGTNVDKIVINFK
jgi:hypothetical protein